MFTIEQLTQLSNFLIEDFKGVFATREEMNERFDRIHNTLDGLSKRIEENTQEITVNGHRTNVIEDWVTEAAPKIGLKYKP